MSICATEVHHLGARSLSPPRGYRSHAEDIPSGAAMEPLQIA
jgi:hypothetical protein